VARFVHRRTTSSDARAGLEDPRFGSFQNIFRGVSNCLLSRCGFVGQLARSMIPLSSRLHIATRDSSAGAPNRNELRSNASPTAWDYSKIHFEYRMSCASECTYPPLESVCFLLKNPPCACFLNRLKFTTPSQPCRNFKP